MLEKYQGENNFILSTDKYYFIKAVENNDVGTITYIKKRFPILRDKLTKTCKAKRLVDAAAVLMLTAELILQYGDSIGALSVEQHMKFEKEWERSIIETINNSYVQAKELAPMVQYLVAVDTSINNHSISIAANKNNYCENVSKFYGFYDEDYLYLKYDWAYKVVTDYWHNLNKHFSMSTGKIHKELNDAKLLRTQGTENLYKVTLDGKRVKMLVIDRTQLQKVIASLEN